MTQADTQPGKGSYAQVNGLALYYEIHGQGQPTILLHGSWDGSGMSHAQLAILPGTTHYTISASPVLATMAAAFLDTPV